MILKKIKKFNSLKNQIITYFNIEKKLDIKFLYNILDKEKINLEDITFDNIYNLLIKILQFNYFNFQLPKQNYISKDDLNSITNNEETSKSIKNEFKNFIDFSNNVIEHDRTVTDYTDISQDSDNNENFNYCSKIINEM
jgi:hypothetical protein